MNPGREAVGDNGHGGGCVRILKACFVFFRLPLFRPRDGGGSGKMGYMMVIFGGRKV